MHRVHNLFPDDCRHLPPRATYRLGSLSFSWGVHVSHALTLFSIPPTSPSPHILHCQQGAESGDDGTRYRTRTPRNEKSRVYHFPLPFIDFTSNRILSPLVTDLSLRPASIHSSLRYSMSREKVFGGLSSSSGNIYAIYIWRELIFLKM